MKLYYSLHTKITVESVYNDGKTGGCANEEYIKNSYKVNCVWKYCPYRKEKRDGRREGC